MPHLLSLLAAHRWLALAAALAPILIGVVVRLLKDDTSIVPFVVPARWRPWLALGLGFASGVVAKVAAGIPWPVAILGGLTSGVVPIAAHDLVIEGLLGGHELPVPAGPLPELAATPRLATPVEPPPAPPLTADAARDLRGPGGVA